MKKRLLGLIFCILMSSFVIAQGPRDGMMQGQNLINKNIEGGDISELSQQEIDGLKFMREEEKLARDVYLDLYAQWKLPIFSNIARSEQTHTDAVNTLLALYDIEDPIVSDEGGEFTNQELKKLYLSLVEKGKESLLDALIVSATVEDLDIKDLNELLAQTTNEDIILVYENLRKGSRNHLRAFNRQIENNGGEYEAQYISSDELASILSSEQERGAIIDDESNIVSNFQNQLQRGQRRGLGQGIYSDSKGNRFNIRQQGNKRMMESEGRSIGCPLCDNMMQEGERFNARLSNGRNAEIKVMPDTASETALQRLRLRNCNENCTIELKEVGSGSQVRAAYEVHAQRNSRVFGLFRARMNVQAQVDAETGEMIQVKKPWWAFLATESEE